uniref:Uncharacterized protein n=1 Tax=Cajanus cajan TaxID=3821 RepID=A0A151SXH7_CAJCA|nr:hypothetical protein KK1_014928 [Cajanus cajan]
MGKEVTLAEWLLKSPIMEKDGNCNGDHCDFKHRYPSVARARTNFSDSGEYTLSLEQPLNGDYTTLSMDFNISSENLLKDEKVNSLTRSQSSRVKKRVSFRLPEVSDTIILYPLEMDFKEC